jgi:3-ketosteroid 9alpha-monooxygenase subunit A
VQAEMTERYEFEVDTTKANEYWHAEVEENLARKAAEEASGESSEDAEVPSPTAAGGV